MTSTFHPGYNPLIRKLGSVFTLTDDERQALEGLPMQVAVIKDRQDIVREGDSPSRSCLILSGFARVYKMTVHGKRQIVSFTIAGDIPDLQSLHLKVLDNSVATICPCTLGFIQHEDMRRVCERYPRIAAAFWRETLVDASIFREWLLNIGRREAYTRLAHFLCEFLVRLKVVGLVEDDTFDLPITQVELADAIATSNVHVNRVLQAMRANGLIQTRGTQVIVPDWERLKEEGEFDPLYLHLQQEGDA